MSNVIQRVIDEVAFHPEGITNKSNAIVLANLIVEMSSTQHSKDH